MVCSCSKVLDSYLKKLMDKQDHIERDCRDMIVKIQYVLMREQNIISPHMLIHPLYSNTAPYIEGHLRVTFTWLWLSSHTLHVEMGRWSRPPAHLHVCDMGIQNEEHLLLCPHTKGHPCKIRTWLHRAEFSLHQHKFVIQACLTMLGHRWEMGG